MHPNSHLWLGLGHKSTSGNRSWFRLTLGFDLSPTLIKCCQCLKITIKELNNAVVTMSRYCITRSNQIKYVDSEHFATCQHFLIMLNVTYHMSAGITFPSKQISRTLMEFPGDRVDYEEKVQFLFQRTVRFGIFGLMCLFHHYFSLAAICVLQRGKKRRGN